MRITMENIKNTDSWATQHWCSDSVGKDGTPKLAFWPLLRLFWYPMRFGNYSSTAVPVWKQYNFVVKTQDPFVLYFSFFSYIHVHVSQKKIIWHPIGRYARKNCWSERKRLCDALQTYHYLIHVEALHLIFAKFSFPWTLTSEAS